LKLLVCGGAGFIGSAFVRRRLEFGTDEVVVLDKLTYAGNRENLSGIDAAPELAARLDFVQGDIADPATVREVISSSRPDAIVNFAAESHVDRSLIDPSAFIRTGVLGVHTLLEATRAFHADSVDKNRKPPRFVQVSTDEVYGPTPNGSRGEHDPLVPTNPYSAAKAAGDLLVMAYRHSYGLDTVVTRGSNTYGPFQFPEKIVPLFTTNALSGLPLPVYGDGQQRRQWLHVDDHADAIWHVLVRGESGGIYNIPGTAELTNLELTRRILAALDKPLSLIRHVADRPGHDVRYALDGTRLFSLGWQPAVAFDQGLIDTVRWYCDHESWWQRLHDEDWDVYMKRQYADRLSETAAP
jgi:dTDP-glucose 4,6-dehydratase